MKWIKIRKCTLITWVSSKFPKVAQHQGQHNAIVPYVKVDYANLSIVKIWKDAYLGLSCIYIPNCT